MKGMKSPLQIFLIILQCRKCKLIHRFSYKINNYSKGVIPKMQIDRMAKNLVIAQLCLVTEKQSCYNRNKMC